MERDRLLEGLDDDQREAVTSEAAPLVILAGPGSGKTRVLTRRIARRIVDGTADAEHVLALTFTRRAAGELQHRLRHLGIRATVPAGTFHALAWAQLRQRWQDRGGRPPALLERKAAILTPLLGSRDRSSLTNATVATEIEWAKARMIDPAGYAAAAARARRRVDGSLSAVAEVYERYEADKRKRRLVDFDDLLTLLAREIERDAEFAAVQRWRFRHLHVDEFQDVNPAQARLLDAWLGPRRDLCVVGDPNQSIYAWNGADPGLLAHFIETTDGVTVVRLRNNYRSAAPVVAAAEAVLGMAGLEPGRQRAVPGDGPAPVVSSYDDERAEAGAVARAIAVRRPTPWSHIAVLVRTHAQAALIEQALRAAGVPCQVRGGGSLLDAPEVARWRRRAEATGGPLRPHLDDLRQSLAPLDRDPDRDPDDEDDDPNGARRSSPDGTTALLDALVQIGLDHLVVDPSATVASFCAWLGSGGPDDRTEREAVDVATFHAAKGLEWPIVYIAGLETGLVPIGHAFGPEARDEEARLLYVALTRAERELHLSWARSRSFGGQASVRSRTPWLDAVDRIAADFDVPPVDDRLQQLARARNVLPKSTPEPLDPVLVALTEWRERSARANRVSPAALLSDAALHDIARIRPRSTSDLAAIAGVGPVKTSRYGETILALIESAVPALEAPVTSPTRRVRRPSSRTAPDRSR